MRSANPATQFESIREERILEGRGSEVSRRLVPYIDAPDNRIDGLRLNLLGLVLGIVLFQIEKKQGIMED